MRAIIFAVAGLAMGSGLAGCDQTTSPAPQQQTAQVAAPVAPPCNCGQTAAPDNHLTRLSSVPRHEYRHRTARRSYESYHGSYTSRSEESVDSYGYVSASTVSSYRESDADYGAGDEGRGYYAGGHHYYRGGVAWVDGYGRVYARNDRPTIADTMNGKRVDPWAGYDANCPQGTGQDGY